MPTDVDRGGVSVPLADHILDEVAPASRIRAFAATFASESAFRMFYDGALPVVYGYLLRRCGDSSRAEDLTQATFIEAVRRRGAFDGRSDPVTWVVGIARHKLVDSFRQEAREERRRLRLEVREITVDADERTWRRADDGEELAAALARLPALQRAALVLHYADGLPVRDVARRIGRSESATESLLTRGRLAVRAAWGETSHD